MFAHWQKCYDLHINEKPASACLASRIPVGTPVTSERLMQVDRAEAELRRFGFRHVRVRHHGDVARIELGSGEADRLSEPESRGQVASALKAAGFRFVALDLEGYREGSLSAEGPRASLLDRPQTRRRPVAPHHATAQPMPGNASEVPAVAAFRRIVPQET